MSSRYYDWEFHQAGVHIKDAGLRIIRLVWSGARMKDTSYLVRMDCCGGELHVTHEQIQQRKRRTNASGPRKRCSECSNLPFQKTDDATKKKRRPPPPLAIGFPLPTWEKPASVPTGHRADLLR